MTFPVSGPRRVGGRAVGTAAALVAAALLAGCGGGHRSAQLDPASGRASTSLTTSPSTTVSLVPARQAVVAAANRFAELARQCSTNPTKCDLSAVAGPPEVAAFAQKMAALATHGLKVRLTPASHLVINSVSIDDPPTQATVAVCQVDADVVYTPGAGPGGRDVIYNNAVDSYQNTWVFHLDPVGGTQWKLYSDTRTSQSAGATCAPTS